MALSFGLLGIMTVMIGSIRGAGDTKKAMVLYVYFDGDYRVIVL